MYCAQLINSLITDWYKYNIAKEPVCLLEDGIIALHFPVRIGLKPKGIMTREPYES
jgi:hypothetical protein